MLVIMFLLAQLSFGEALITHRLTQVKNFKTVKGDTSLIHMVYKQLINLVKTNQYYPTRKDMIQAQKNDV